MNDSAVTSERTRSRRVDPLLVATQVLLGILLAGVLLAAFVTSVGIVTQLAAHGIPWRTVPWDPVWRPLSDLLFALAALWLVGDSVWQVLGMINSVQREEAFDPANVSRLERIAWNTIGLAILGAVARMVGSGIEGDVNGFEIGVDLPTSIGFALLLFVLARVFRHGAAMRDDLEGTV